MVRATYYSHLSTQLGSGLVADTAVQECQGGLNAGAARGFAIQAIDQDHLTSMLALICAGTARLVDALNKFTRGFGFIRPGLVA